jgi:hypothetical protein
MTLTLDSPKPKPDPTQFSHHHPSPLFFFFLNTIAMSCQTQLSYACMLGLIDRVRSGHSYLTSSYSCMSPADRASCLLRAILVSFETGWLTLLSSVCASCKISNPLSMKGFVQPLDLSLSLSLYLVLSVIDPLSQPARRFALVRFHLPVFSSFRGPVRCSRPAPTEPAQPAQVQLSAHG